jgi:hypothetical protein
MKMKTFSVDIKVPYVFIKRKDKTSLVPSMVMSTVFTCALITFIPQLVPVWMQLASTLK